MADCRKEIEDELEGLQEELKSLVSERVILQEKFTNLTQLEGELTLQLQDDNFASEGHLHSFHFEKKDVEDQLLKLETKLAEKMNRIKELDEKASEYLLKVSSDSNSVYEDEGNEEEETNEDQRNLIEKLLYDDMVENEDMSSETETGSCCTDTENMVDAKVFNETTENGEYKDDGPKSANVDKEISMSASLAADTAALCTNEDIISLSALVNELKKVKEDMGQQMPSKDTSLIDLEDQLQSTRKELAVLKDSMLNMSHHLRVSDDEYIVDGSGRHIRSSGRRATDSSSQQSSMSDADSEEIFNEMDALDQLLCNIEPKFDDDSPVDFGRGSSRIASFRAPSSTSISERVAMLEQNLTDSTEALRESKKQLKQMFKEKKYKDKECNDLQEKVKMVETKMSELQNTFDVLIRAIMTEKEGYVKDLQTKTEEIKSLEEKLLLVPEKVENTVEESVMNEKIEEIESQYRDDIELLQSQISVMKENHNKEKEDLSKKHENIVSKFEIDISVVKEEKITVESKLSQIEEVSNEELSHMKKDNDELKKEISQLKEKCDSTVQLSSDLQDHKEENNSVLEILKQQIDEQQQQIDDLNAKNIIISSEMYNKDEEYNEELTAREGTIQELRITLTNNQKQSRENFQMAQDDVATLQMKIQKDAEEAQVIVTLLKEKVIKLEDDFQLKQQECDEINNVINGGQAIKTNHKICSDLIISPADADDVSSKTIEENEQKMDKTASPSILGVSSIEQQGKDNEKDEANIFKTQEEKDNGYALLMEKIKRLEDTLLGKSSCIIELENKLKEISDSKMSNENPAEQNSECSSEVIVLIEKIKNLEEILQGKSNLEGNPAERDCQSHDENHSVSECSNDMVNFLEKVKKLEKTLQEKLSYSLELEIKLQETSDSSKSKESSGDQAIKIDSEAVVMIDKIRNLEENLQEKANIIVELERKLQGISSDIEPAQQISGQNETIVLTDKIKNLEESLQEKSKCIADLEKKSSEKLESMSSENNEDLKLSKQIPEIDNYTEQIKKLEENLLEKTSRIAELERKREGITDLKTVGIEPEKKSMMEKQMEQIQELNAFIDELKEKLNESERQRIALKETVEKNKTGINVGEDQVIRQGEFGGQEKISNSKTDGAKEALVSSSSEHPQKSTESGLLGSIQNEQTECKEERGEKSLQQDEEKLAKDIEEKKSLINSLECQLLEVENSLTCDPKVVENLSFIDRITNIKQLLEQKIILLESKHDNDEYKAESLHKCFKCGTHLLAVTKPEQASNANKEFSHSENISSIGDHEVKNSDDGMEDKTDLESHVGQETVESLSLKLKKVRVQNKKLSSDKQILTKTYETEQAKTLDMQNQMVNDMESLILNLEAEKDQLHKELVKVKLQISLGSIKEEDEESKSNSPDILGATPGNISHDIKLPSSENVVTADLSEKSSDELVSLIGKLSEKIQFFEVKIEVTEQNAAKELETERLNHIEQMKLLRKDIREEIDILEQQKDDVAENLSKDMVKVSSDWAKRLEEREKELGQSSDEVKAQFGQVLVAKNNEQEKLTEERQKEMDICKIRVKSLQKKLEDKTNIVEELEKNMSEMVIVRANLEDTILQLKGAEARRASLKTIEQKPSGKPATIDKDKPSELTGTRSKKKRVPSIYEDNMAAQDLLKKSSSLSSISSSRETSLTPRGAGALSPDLYNRSGASSPHSYSPNLTRSKKVSSPMSFPPVRTSSPSWPSYTPFDGQ